MKARYCMTDITPKRLREIEAYLSQRSDAPTPSVRKPEAQHLHVTPEQTTDPISTPEPEHLETQFRVKGKEGRKALCLKLREAFEGTDTPGCALVIGDPEAV